MSFFATNRCFGRKFAAHFFQKLRIDGTAWAVNKSSLCIRRTCLKVLRGRSRNSIPFRTLITCLVEQHWVFGLVGPNQDQRRAIEPETYLVAVSELLGLMFVVVWFVGSIFDGGVVVDNPFLAHLGYNNLCVSPGLVLVMVHFFTTCPP